MISFHTSKICAYLYSNAHYFSCRKWKLSHLFYSERQILSFHFQDNGRIVFKTPVYRVTGKFQITLMAKDLNRQHIVSMERKTDGGMGGQDSKLPAKWVDTVTAVLEMRSEGDERALQVAFMVACRVSHGAHSSWWAQTSVLPSTLFLF